MTDLVRRALLDLERDSGKRVYEQGALGSCECGGKVHLWEGFRFASCLTCGKVYDGQVLKFRQSVVEES